MQQCSLHARCVRLHKFLDASAVHVPSTYQPLCVTEGRTHMRFSTATKQLHLCHTVLQVRRLNKPPWVSHTHSVLFSTPGVHCMIPHSAEPHSSCACWLAACVQHTPAGTVHKHGSCLPAHIKQQVHHTTHQGRARALTPGTRLSKYPRHAPPLCAGQTGSTQRFCDHMSRPLMDAREGHVDTQRRAWWEDRGRMRNTTPQARPIEHCRWRTA